MADSHDRRLDLTKDEERALIALLRKTLNYTCYPPWPQPAQIDPGEAGLQCERLRACVT